MKDIKMKFIIIILLLCLLMPVASAIEPTDVMSETKFKFIEIPSSMGSNELGLFRGQLSYANGTELEILYMDRIFIYTYVNGHETYGLTLCNATGHFDLYLWTGLRNPAIYDLKTGTNEIKFVFKDTKDYLGLLPSSSSIYTLNVNEIPDQNHTGNFGMLKLIGYAKGVFILSWFSILFATVAIGCVSVRSENPQTKANSEYRLFYLLRVLVTVSILYLFVLYLMSF